MKKWHSTCNRLYFLRECHAHTLTSILRGPHSHFNTSLERTTLTLWHIPIESHAHTCSVLQCVVAVCCSVLQCVAVCCSVLQCVAVCCSVLQCVATLTLEHLFRESHTHTLTSFYKEPHTLQDLSREVTHTYKPLSREATQNFSREVEHTHFHTSLGR